MEFHLFKKWCKECARSPSRSGLLGTDGLATASARHSRDQLVAFLAKPIV